VPHHPGPTADVLGGRPAPAAGVPERAAVVHAGVPVPARRRLAVEQLEPGRGRRAGAGRRADYRSLTSRVQRGSREAPTGHTPRRLPASATLCRVLAPAVRRLPNQFNSVAISDRSTDGWPAPAAWRVEPGVQRVPVDHQAAARRLVLLLPVDKQLQASVV